MSIELELIDCNCNNCIFMDRDMQKFKMYHEIKEIQALEHFERIKQKAIEDAHNTIANSRPEDLKGAEGLLRVAEKMRFQFDKSTLVHYGNCTKKSKPIAFLPNICQIETQDCFKHRRIN
jgi:hypothetical protein